MKAYVICRPKDKNPGDEFEYLNDKNGETYHFANESAARWFLTCNGYAGEKGNARMTAEGIIIKEIDVD